MIFGWINVETIGAITSGSLSLLWLSRIVAVVEGRFSRHFFRARPRHVVLPFEHQADEFLKRSHVKMTAKQWYGLMVGIPIFVASLGLMTSGNWTIGLGVGLYLSVTLLLFPYQKRKKFNLDMGLQIQRTKRMMAKLYARDLQADEMLAVVVEALEDGESKNYMKLAIQRTKTVDTLSKAIEWMSDEIQVPSLRALAIVLMQGSHYANLPLDERLAKMAEKDRDKTLINYDKIAEGKRMRALLEAGTFVVFPLIGLLSAFVFYYVYQQFTGIQLF